MNTIACRYRLPRRNCPRARLLLPLLTLALALAACTKDHVLGAADDTDGGSDGPVADSGPDGPVPADARDAPGAPDAPAAAVCVDNGVSYHAGDIIPRGSSTCAVSCLCFANGTIGACTGACPGGTAPDAGPPTLLALIRVSASTNSPEIDVAVYSDGSADRTAGGSAGTMPPSVRTFAVGSPEGIMFLTHLAAIDNLGDVGDPNVVPLNLCPKSVSSGTVTKVTAGGVTSGDMQCLTNPTAAETGLAHDCDVLTARDDPNFGLTAQLCVNTMGQVSSALCCASGADFPDMCATGACGCSPADSHAVSTCVCPSGGCFLPSYGCAGPVGACTFGDDSTCNDNIAANGFHGHCLTDGRCACNSGFHLVTASGRCQ
jgi:hypothetical protein